MQELAISESLTLHRRDERGYYGRRSSTQLRVQDVFVYPHLYGALVLHEQGCAKVLAHPPLNKYVRVRRLVLVSSSFSFFSFV